MKGIGATVPEVVGDTTLTAKNQVSLPAKRMRELGWKQGDRLIVEVLAEDMVLLIRRPARWTETFAGRLTHVFGSHEENVDWIQGERAGWDEER